jgi:hypothetical protein
MTNFESWKQTANLEDILRMSASIDGLNFKRHKSYTAFHCANCPAKQFCDDDKTEDSCRLIFRKWATAIEDDAPAIKGSLVFNQNEISYGTFLNQIIKRLVIARDRKSVV